MIMYSERMILLQTKLDIIMFAVEQFPAEIQRIQIELTELGALDVEISLSLHIYFFR